MPFKSGNVIVSKDLWRLHLNIIKTLQRAERKLEKEAHKIGKELNGLRNAIVALGHRGKPAKTGKKRGMSAATRRKIAAAQKARWAKGRAGKKTADKAGKRTKEASRKIPND